MRICGAYFDLLVARSVQSRVHLVQQEEPAAASLLHRFAHDLAGDAADLDVHLQRGNALAGSGDLEVHIAVVIFRAGDVGQDGVVVALLDQAHRDAGDRRLERNAGIHQRQAGSADRRHRRRTVRLQNVGDDAERIWRLFLVRQNRAHGALGQRSVADFAATYAGHASHFADRERREVVVQHEALLLLALEGLQALRVVACAQGRRYQRLRFAAGEERRAVRAGQNADFDGDGTNFVECTAVGTDALLGDLLAEDVLAQSLVVFRELLLRVRNFLTVGHPGCQLVLDLLDQRVAFGLWMLLGVERILEPVADLGASGPNSTPCRTPEAQPRASACRPAPPAPRCRQRSS